MLQPVDSGKIGGKLGYYKRIGGDIQFKASFHFENQLLKSINIQPSKSLSYEIPYDLNERQALMEWMEAFFQKRLLPFPLSLSLDHLSPFTQKVLKELLKIPFGHRKSYGEIARQCGNPKAARAVGNACRANPYPLAIPCHRVVGNNGSLCGFAYGTKLKKQLLEFENLSSHPTAYAPEPMDLL